MAEQRKHPVPAPEVEESFPQWLPLYVVYPFIGFLIALATPLGAFLLRYLQADPVLTSLWMRSELSYNSVFYVYMGLGSALSFVSFGYVLGAFSESQRVHNKDLRERMEDLHLKSVTDGLTGAFSHAFLHETLGIEIERSRRHSRPLSVLMMDLDDFKELNDAHGHLFGDRVLQELTETLNMNIRQEDVLGRYGGEEFLVIMPGADAKVAKRVAERVRKAVARMAVLHVSGKRRIRMTLSIGVASFTGDMERSSSLLERADRNLYRAKRQGKNRVAA